MRTNVWCRALSIEAPRLEVVARGKDVNTFLLLIATLLERGVPMSLDDVAARFESAGIADRESASSSLKRCRPNRRPLYREGDIYHLDPYDIEADIALRRLGLKSRVIVPSPPPAPNDGPAPGPDVPLSPVELDYAWNSAMLYSWSAQRLAVAVLDAHGGPLAPNDVVALVTKRTWEHPLDPRSEKFQRKGKGVQVLEDGRWALADDASEIVAKTRTAVRVRGAANRRRGTRSSGFEAARLAQEAFRDKRAAHAAELAQLTRALLVAHPCRAPRAVVLLDIGQRTLAFFEANALTELRARLARYDLIAAVGVRELLRDLGLDPHGRRVAELGPPQQTRVVDQHPFAITTAMLVAGTCRIAQPFGDDATLAAHLARGDHESFRRHLENDAKSLYALYEYGRLHGHVRLRSGTVDEPFSVPWVHRDEPTIHSLMESAREQGVPLQVVVGAAPRWKDPWASARRAHVVVTDLIWNFLGVVDDTGAPIEIADIQRARLLGPREFGAGGGRRR